MIDAVMRAARNMPELVGYQHFEIEEIIWMLADSIMQDRIADLNDGDEDPRLPNYGNLPSPKMTMHVVLNDNGINHSIFLKLTEHNYFENGEYTKIEVLGNNGLFGAVGYIAPGKHSDIDLSDSNQENAIRLRLVENVGYAIALINEPRIVARSPAGTRQQRRAAHRGMGFAVDAWTRVTWDLSKETVAKISRDPTFHKVPLHWRRGHFRQAESHYRGAIQRPDAFRVEDRQLWWQWIDGQWVGHPAFGIKRSVHAPKLSTGELARRRQSHA